MSITGAEAKQWLLEFHKASATLNTTHWLSTFFSPSASMTYGNMPTVPGRDNCHLLFEAFLSRLSEMTHHIESFDYIAGERKILQAARIVYRVKGDKEEKVIQIPGFAAFTLERDADGVIRLVKAQTWLDPSPVTERIVEVHGKERWEQEIGDLLRTVAKTA